MSIVGRVVVGNFPYGNPGSLGEPLGIWTGEQDLTGDASGGFVVASFIPQNPTDTPTLPDQRRQYVYFVDGVGISANTDPGNLGVDIFAHWARSNSALTNRFTHQLHRDAITDGSTFAPSGPLMQDYMRRTPIFWDTQELAANSDIIVTLHAQTNTLATVYQARCYGRYYDRQVLSNRAFGRLISPVAQSQFEG